ncbi:MAG: C4-dicarboxylate ABC transporter permease [Alphaproteobacteria bacterium]|nr:C4-dicarboxylate ABC transporter permease [Alphaproteobacteria bacterium]MAS47320.1 C4-dicarboxylate ABC transporter permease [Alphaproteobacteria bacterium]MAX95413.1 C4-dicarboxylate ABC transporter permease [Alphaproteobacteria bacterium]MBN52372.1 C4-dicarboxylate ABC transporter permease [Alphaproteobacteria bacterium]
MPGFTETGKLRLLIMALGVGISLLHIYFNIITLLPTLWQNALHYAGFALLCVLIYPTSKAKREAGKLHWTFILDIAIGVAAAASAIYLVAMEDAIYARGVRMTDAEWVAGFILIASALELTRRTTGWIIPVLIVLALTYIVYWGQFVPGVFNFAGLSLETALFRSIFGDDGIFGNIALISSTFVFMFILFGAFLMRSGGGDFVIDLARALAGRTTGGPGLVAVIASGLTGTISGSAVANSASTGVITIPLMKKAGFPAKFAAGVEAAASTGGQLMPPIMGAGAFVMASYTQIPYTTIVAASVLPAILYFASVGFFVRIEAKRSGVRPSADAGVSFLDVFKQGGFAFLLPIAVLITLLIVGFTPTYAAGISILAVIASSWLTPNRMGPKAIIEAMALGARNMAMTAILLCAVGLVVNVIATAGIGNTFSLMITEWAGNSLIIAIVLIALASLVLGMGLPVTAAYIVLGTLSAPALFNLIADVQVIQAITDGTLPEQARTIMMISIPDALTALAQPMPYDQAAALYDGIPIDLKSTVRDIALDPAVAMTALLAAHLIIFWLSQDSNVTPPVCLTAFTVAAIAKTPPMATGMTSWKIAKGLYIMPLLFAYTPILSGDWVAAITVSIFALFGLYYFTAAISGHMERAINPLERIVMLAAAALCLWPSMIWLHLLGVAIGAGIFAWHLRRPETEVQVATDTAAAEAADTATANPEA